jgi:hypothetical protein
MFPKLVPTVGRCTQLVIELALAVGVYSTNSRAVVWIFPARSEFQERNHTARRILITLLYKGTHCQPKILPRRIDHPLVGTLISL